MAVCIKIPWMHVLRMQTQRHPWMSRSGWWPALTSAVHERYYFLFGVAYFPATAHLRGTDIIAQKTFTLTQEAQNLQFRGYGFKLHVQKGSLPAEVSEATLNVRVSLSGQFQMPPDCELLSAVYWVYSPHTFIKPLTIEIQHSAVLSSAQQCSQLTFVSTKCTQKELPYVFKLRDHHSSYGSLSLPHFSGHGVAKRIIRFPEGRADLNLIHSLSLFKPPPKSQSS